MLEEAVVVAHDEQRLHLAEGVERDAVGQRVLKADGHRQRHQRAVERLVTDNPAHDSFWGKQIDRHTEKPYRCPLVNWD